MEAVPFMFLIRSIQAEAIEAATSVSSLLRKCKLLAARLDHAQLAQWVEQELNGYPDDADLPAYRVTCAYSYGNFAGPFSTATDLQTPVTVLPEHCTSITAPRGWATPSATMKAWCKARNRRPCSCPGMSHWRPSTRPS